MGAVVIIPARFNSTRFPGKPLTTILGIPMIQHVYKRTSKATMIERVIVATDDMRVFDAVKGFGGEVVMTSPQHRSGSDRIAEVAKSISYDIIVNVQGDEPLILPDMVNSVVDILNTEPSASIGTLCKKINDVEELLDPNVVKVVFDRDGFAIYFSRSPIPFHRDDWKIADCGMQIADLEHETECILRFTIHDSRFTAYKHLGIYSYRRDVLLTLSSLQPSSLESLEKLEQLRAIENGFKIKVRETTFDTIGVDTIEDVEKVAKRLKACSERSESNG